MDFDITFKNGRAITIRGARLAATHRDYGPTTYIEDGDKKHVFQCCSDLIASVSKHSNASTTPARDGSGDGASTFRVFFRDGRMSEVDGCRLSFTHRDYGPRTYVEDEAGTEIFQANSDDIFFVCRMSALLSDSPREPDRDQSPSQNDVQRPMPCEKAEGFVFVSYKREDMPQITPYLRRLCEWGYDIWYDRGIPGGSEWDAMIEAKVDACQLLLVFLSQEAADSKWVRREIKFADSRNKPILVVQMGDVTPRHGLNITLSQYQMISETADDFSDELKRAVEYVRLL